MRMTSMKDEKDLIEAIITQDNELYRQLVDRYKAGLIIHCEHIVRDRDQAEDIAQEAFIKAYYQLSKFNTDKGRFSTWLYKIATNTAFDYLRKNKHKVDIEEIESRADETMPAHLEEDEKQIIRDAIATLEPPKYGEVIKAYFWEGKSYFEIAKQYDTTTSTIGTWIRRAKAQLKEKLV
jgi:RNA polymerase sigma-70 factor (ECF subfamily)